MRKMLVVGVGFLRLGWWLVGVVVGVVGVRGPARSREGVYGMRVEDVGGWGRCV